MPLKKLVVSSFFAVFVRRAGMGGNNCAIFISLHSRNKPSFDRKQSG